jgi:hypothetical protein
VALTEAMAFGANVTWSKCDGMLLSDDIAFFDGILRSGKILKVFFRHGDLSVL